jgi:Gpi18-like mannosyltransferase
MTHGGAAWTDASPSSRPGGSSTDSRPVFEAWSRWDAPHYTDIAAFGYQAIGTDSVGPGGYRSAQPDALPTYIVFYPLYPWLVGVLNLFGDPVLAAFLVSGIASLLVGPLLYRLVAIELGPAVGRRSVLFLLLFPTAYFLHIGYTESLFLALALGSLLAARRPRRRPVRVLAPQLRRGA